jgi:hypothetical protein
MWEARILFGIGYLHKDIGGEGRGGGGNWSEKGDLDSVEMDEGKFFSSMTIENRHDKICWRS